MSMKIRVLCVMSILFLLVMASAAGQEFQITENPEIILQVKPGFEGYYKYQQWVLINIMVENLGNHFRGDLVVSINDYSHKNVQVKKSVELPSGTPKQFQIYMPCTSNYYYGRELIVELVDKSGKTIASTLEELKQIDYSKSLMLVLSEKKNELNYLSGAQTNLWAGTSLEVIYPEARYLPRNWIGYRGVDIIVINNFSLSDKLDALQIKALEDWLKAGGNVLVSSNGEPGEFFDTFLSEALPLELHENILLTQMSSLATYTGNLISVEPPGVSLVKGNLKDLSSNVLLEQDGIPLIVTSHFGTGCISFISFDISREPFKNWDYKLVFWEKVFGEIQFNELIPVGITDDEGQRILFDIPSLKPPSFKFIGMFLFIYILLVGPVNYWVLRKWDKREFAVFTIPLLVFFFSIGTYIMGYSSKGGSVRLSQVSIIKLNGENSWGESFVSLFSPGKTDYKMEFRDKSTCADIMSGYNDLANNITVREEEFYSFENINLNMWSMIAVKAYSTRDLAGGVKISDLNFQLN